MQRNALSIFTTTRTLTVIKTKDRDQSAQTIVFASRMIGEGDDWPEQQQTRRFMARETFFRTVGGRSDLVRSLVTAAHRVLVSEEIRDEHDVTAKVGREKYNLQALI